MNRREAMLSFVGVAMGLGLREGEVTQVDGLYPETCHARDAAQILVDLRDGLKQRKMPCSDWAFRELYQEVCSCVNSIDLFGRTRNVESVRMMLQRYLDYAKKEYTDKGEPLPYGEGRESEAT
jgi:hypothetical protein